MEGFLIKGPCRLEGRVRASGSKNSALPMLFSSLLFEEEVMFENVPRLWDIETTLKLLESMGASTRWDKEEGTVAITPSITKREASYEWVSRMRAGILALGPLVAKYGEARVSLPGGCAIGARPVNYHIEALRKMGVAIEVEGGYLEAKVPHRLTGAHITFPKVTVTGTENILIVACVAQGQTLIENAASEPEVQALGSLLVRLGADIQGLGTNRIVVNGGTLSRPLAPIRIPGDRIETATWMAGAVATGGDLTIEGSSLSEMVLVKEAFEKMGAKIDVENDEPHGSTFRVQAPEKLEPISLETAPYPGFPTDMQAQILVPMCLAEGTSQVRETVFENRFMHVAELRRMGAKIDVDGNLASIKGPVQLKGAPVMATDLRASASLVLAALCAAGETSIRRIYHLDRGYQRLDKKLQALGIEVQRKKLD